MGVYLKLIFYKPKISFLHAIMFRPYVLNIHYENIIKQTGPYLNQYLQKCNNMILDWISVVI